MGKIVICFTPLILQHHPFHIKVLLFLRKLFIEVRKTAAQNLISLFCLFTCTAAILSHANDSSKVVFI